MGGEEEVYAAWEGGGRMPHGGLTGSSGRHACHA